jgi:hypothetical protein
MVGAIFRDISYNKFKSKRDLNKKKNPYKKIV